MGLGGRRLGLWFSTDVFRIPAASARSITPRVADSVFKAMYIASTSLEGAMQALCPHMQHVARSSYFVLMERFSRSRYTEWCDLLETDIAAASSFRKDHPILHGTILVAAKVHMNQGLLDAEG